MMMRIVSDVIMTFDNNDDDKENDEIWD